MDRNKITITLYCDYELRIEDLRALLITAEKDLAWTLDDRYAHSEIMGDIENTWVTVAWSR